MLSPSFPDVASLDLYVSVIELGSLSKAAQLHGITQPSASGRIQHLERQLGVTLLRRGPSGSAPTDAGVVVAGWAQGLLNAAQELEAGVAALKAQRRVHLRVGASFTIAEYLLPPWLERFSRAHPDAQISLQVANSAAVFSLLERGEVDLGFVETPDEPRDGPPLSQQAVANDELICVVAPPHPWAKRPSVPLQALLATPLIMRERGSGTREALVAALRERGLGAPVSVLELGSTSAVRSAVLGGHSPTFISRLAVAGDLANGTLVEVNVAELSVRRLLRALWLTHTGLSPLAAALLDAAPG